MPKSGWKQLLAGARNFQGNGHFPIAAYSEFMPPPWLGRKPYGPVDDSLFSEDDLFGWNITEYEEALEMKPGLEKLAHQLAGALIHLGTGTHAHGIARAKLLNNPFWPETLAQKAGSLPHERFVTILPLAFSRTQDDKGRLRWTLFGASEQGPARAFWKSFYHAPGREIPTEQSWTMIREFLYEIYAETVDDLYEAGFRIMPQDAPPLLSYWKEGKLPKWTAPFIMGPRQSLKSVKYLLTFQPFSSLPGAVQKAYLAGGVHLIPFPGSLFFWGTAGYHRLQKELPLAMQIPLLHSVARREAPGGIRVPQAGWLHEPHPDQPHPGNHHGPIRNTFRRTHRWAKVHRDEDELAIEAREDKLLHVLFSTSPDDLGLYGKPMARNVQLWTREFQLLLDGPRATPEQIKRAEHAIVHGGLFGYRFQYPAMRVGVHEVYWHRPLIAYQARHTGEPAIFHGGPLGYLTAYHVEKPSCARPIELWPRLLQRKMHMEPLQIVNHAHDPRPYQTVRNICKLLRSQEFFDDKPVPRSLARQLLTLPKHQTLDEWLRALPERTLDPERGRILVKELQQALEMPQHDVAMRGPQRPCPSLTYKRTARRSFEVAYWKLIAELAEGKFVNKVNADCIRDSLTQKLLTHPHRDLDALGDFILAYYSQTVAAAKMTGKALVGDLPFTWQTDFDFSWSGGWLGNQEGRLHERNLIVVIPGKDRKRAVIMADHYDTAYMEDHYEGKLAGKGARLAAAGADDNHSATAALMLGAKVFLELSRARKLACDIWLIHLTGEEFPSDCLGARYLCQKLVEGNLKMRRATGGFVDLSRVRVQGVYVLDMIAHNNDRDHDIFQIAPGNDPESMWLAYQAHLANEAWNTSTTAWNQDPIRQGTGRGRRSPHGGVIPEPAACPQLSGEIRVPYDPRSTLYNTDGQIFCDAGIPVVLFMENYDINRTGYHDTHDTMANIDLDYGSALAAITIEAVARAATEKPIGAKQKPKSRKK